MEFGELDPAQPKQTDPEAEDPWVQRRDPPVCDFCEDDSDFVFEVRVDVYDLDGRAMRGKRICEMCIHDQGFTGWAYANGRWPTRDPLGRAEPLELETEPPMHWSEIGAALEGRTQGQASRAGVLADRRSSLEAR